MNDDDRPIFICVIRWPAEMDPDAKLRREIAMMPMKHDICAVRRCRHFAERHPLGHCEVAGCTCKAFKLPRPKQAYKSDGRPIGRT